MIFKDYLTKLPKCVLTLLLFIGAGTLTAQGQNERIRLENRRMSAGQAIRSIESQTNLIFAYSHTTFDTTAVVTLPETNVTVRQVLDSMVDQKDLKYVIQGRYIAFVPQTPGNRPQVQSHPQRTSDVYTAGMSDGSAAPVTRPDRPQVQPEQPQRVTVPAVAYPASYSAYNRPDRYANLQTSLPRFAIKTNLLYGGVALAPNLAFEFATGPKQTIELSGSYNGWRRSDNDINHANTQDTKQLVHSIFRGEYRWWMCERFNGHFLGAHAFYGRYNVSAKKIPLLFDKENRYDGDAFGAGITYGYNLILGDRWGLEFNVGLGVAYLNYDKYTCASCDMAPIKSDKIYFGPTRLGATLVFHIK